MTIREKCHNLKISEQYHLAEVKNMDKLAKKFFILILLFPLYLRDFLFLKVTPQLRELQKKGGEENEKIINS